MHYISNDWELSQEHGEPFKFVLALILSELRPSKEASFFSVQILGNTDHRALLDCCYGWFVLLIFDNSLKHEYVLCEL